jgi:hypothetical protein
MACPHRHTEHSPCLGQPLCARCYDYAGHAVWNAWASELWRRTTIATNRALAKLGKTHGVTLRLAFAKVAEYQARGLIHFHALLRLNALDPTHPDTPLPRQRESPQPISIRPSPVPSPPPASPHSHTRPIPTARP